MYSIAVEATFSALHQLRLAADGVEEPLHGHDWGVRVWFTARDLDDAGMVIDFHQAQAVLRGVLAGFQHQNLNELGAFDARNPTAEHVARHIFDQIRARGLSVQRVEITEAPGCTAVYESPNECGPGGRFDDRHSKP